MRNLNNLFPKSCPLTRLRKRSTQLVSFYSIALHWLLVFFCFKGFYVGYIPKYNRWQMRRMLDPKN